MEQLGALNSSFVQDFHALSSLLHDPDVRVLRVCAF